MNKIKRMIAKTFFKELLPGVHGTETDKSSGGQRELASEFIKSVIFKTGSATDYEDPDFSMTDIENAYNTDSYVRQGVDKYVDQIFKEGFNFYGTDPNVVTYLNLRMGYIGEATNNPTGQFLSDIAEDLVKYGNVMIVKSRANNADALPQGVKIQGINGKQPIVGYFCANPSTMTVTRDKNGIITKWKQKTDAGEQEFDPADVIHFYYKRPKGNAYGTSFLVPVLDDIRALRQAEENVLKMMYRNIYPFYHVKVGSEESPGTDAEVTKIQDELSGMEVEGGIATTERVEIKPIASDQVIDAKPYLEYMEARVFSGMGIPAIMWGRGNTANRSTGDNMTSEMADRIRAFCKTIEMFFNATIVKELLMEGGYDPVLNPEQSVEFRFNDNDVDVKIKKETHAIYKYEHNAITEDEMRAELGKDPISDQERDLMYVNLITRETANQAAANASNNQTGTSETNNKQKNSGGKKSSSSGSNNSSSSGTVKKSVTKKQAGKDNYNILIGLIKDSIDEMNDEINKYVGNCYDSKNQILQSKIQSIVIKHIKDISYTAKAKIEDKVLLNTLEDLLVKNSTKLCYDIHNDLVGTNTYSTQKGSISDMLDIRMNILTDSLIEYMLRKRDATQYINNTERSSSNGDTSG